MRPGKIALAIVGALLGLAAVGFLVGGSGLLWAQATQRSSDGFFTSPSAELNTSSYALTSTDIDLGSQPGDWFPSGRLATVRLEVEASGGSPVFLGIGPAVDVDRFLDGVAHSEVSSIGPDIDDVSYVNVGGGAPSTEPANQDFWAASAEGPNTQTLSWDLEQGEWIVVVMNADASSGLTVEATAGAQTELLVPVAAMLMAGGLILGTVAAILLIIAVRKGDDEAALGAPQVAPGQFGPYPVRLEGRTDPDLTRWQWLFKWILAIPHLIALFFLWIAFGVLTVVAFFAIVFTGRYPKSIFDFNVGVMRWTWRVGFYSYSVLGTDQYPPFTLAQSDYPAEFDVAYPEHLSRGLALVKWWLLAIPHYLIVGVFTSGLVWWAAELDAGSDAVLQIGGGLIGILVLIAGFALLFVGRYPTGLFDLIMGLNRWVYRVWAYAALMTDEYPPFRLDAGGSEPGPRTPIPPSDPTAGDMVQAPSDVRST